MTKRQKMVLDFIKRYRAKHGFSPSTREIQEGLGMSSPNSMQTHLRALVRDGHLTRQPFTARSFVPVET